MHFIKSSLLKTQTLNCFVLIILTTISLISLIYYDYSFDFQFPCLLKIIPARVWFNSRQKIITVVTIKQITIVTLNNS